MKIVAGEGKKRAKFHTHTHTNVVLSRIPSFIFSHVFFVPCVWFFCPAADVLAISVDHNVQNVAQTCPQPCIVARKITDHLRPDRPQHVVRAPSGAVQEEHADWTSSTNGMRDKRTSCSAVTLLRKAWT